MTDQRKIPKMKCCQIARTGAWRFCPYCGSRIAPVPIRPAGVTKRFGIKVPNDLSGLTAGAVIGKLVRGNLVPVE